MKEVIETDRAPAAVGPYSQALRFGSFIFTSGQLPLDPATGTIVPGGIEAQAERALTNLEILLAEAGGSMDTVLKTTVFLKDMGDFARFNEVYAKFFRLQPPSRSCVEVSRLPKDAAVEIEAVATVRG